MPFRPLPAPTITAEQVTATPGAGRPGSTVAEQLAEVIAQIETGSIAGVQGDGTPGDLGTYTFDAGATRVEFFGQFTAFASDITGYNVAPPSDFGAALIASWGTTSAVPAATGAAYGVAIVAVEVETDITITASATTDSPGDGSALEWTLIFTPLQAVAA